MKRKNLFVGTGLIVACAVVGFVSLGGSSVRPAAFAELDRKPGQLCEVYGKLEAKSIRPLEGANRVRFQLVEEKTSRKLEVLYDNPVSALPANFPAASHAKVTGVYNAADGIFVGNSVQTKCPSKYEEDSLDAVRKQAIRDWQSKTGLTEATSP